MRVGLDARLWHNTGIGRYIRNIAPRLKGVELVVWVLPEHLEEVRASLPQAEVRVCEAKPFSLGEQLALGRAIAQTPLDLFHAPHLNAPLACNVPLVLTIHDLIPLRFPGTINSKLGHWYFAGMSRLAVTRADRVIAVSENTRRDLVSLLKATPGKIRVVGEGADARFAERVPAETLAEIRTRYGLAGPYLLYTGQWKPYKNLETLLRAFAALRPRQPELKLAIVGREDPSQPHVPRLIRELKLDSSVVLTGYLRDESELVALYQGAGVFAFPSRYEGFGLPPLEAMAASVPVVASNAASIPEVVGQAGVLVGPDDVVEWTEALEHTLTDARERERLIALGHERVRTLNWDAAAEGTLAVYRETLQGTPL